MHGQLSRNLDEKLMDNEQSYWWLKSGDINRETESTILAAQDQAVNANYFKNKILREETGGKFQSYKQHEETTDHLTSGCPILAKNEYLMRHDKVCTHLHYSICKALGIEMTDKWNTHTNKQTSKWKEYISVVESSSSTQTDELPICEQEDIHVVESSSTQRQRSYGK